MNVMGCFLIYIVQFFGVGPLMLGDIGVTCSVQEEKRRRKLLGMRQAAGVRE